MPRFASRRSSMTAPLALLITALLAGCSGISADWVKPGASEAQVKADNAACRAEAEEVHGRGADITHDIEVSRPPSAIDTETRSSAIRNYDTRRDYAKIFDACMAARGYSRGEKDEKDK